MTWIVQNQQTPLLQPIASAIADSNLDPGALRDSARRTSPIRGESLNAWENDGSACKSFLLKHPGTYNQMLLVWGGGKWGAGGGSWSHLEMFGSETPDAGGASKNPQK